MILGFKPQFVEPIMNGTKIHTIREDAHDRWKKGNSIQFATGVRTKHYNQFKEGQCISVQEIVIIHNPGFIDVFIDNKPFGQCFHQGFDDIYEWNNNLLELAKNDGFDDLKSLFTWFHHSFSGKIIHWTDFKY